METLARPLNPWVSMWTRPRDTVRHLIRSGSLEMVLVLAALAGIGEVLDNASFQDLGDRYPVTMIVLLAVLLGPALGIVGLYTTGALLGWTGGWLGGTGRSRDVRVAVAWAGLPLVAALGLWLFDLAVFGPEMFTAETPRIEASLGLSLLVMLSGLASFTLAVWSFVLACKAIGEAHRFSAWKALGSMFLAGLVLVVPVVVLAIGVAVLVA